jgi:predicted Zn-dependent peptidase
MEFDLYSLPNGIRLIHKQVRNTKIAHCGIFFDVGSRDESDIESGMAHFWEHMAFKGTNKRKAYHIINRLESVGGEINAYTTKEKICFYASMLDRHLEKAVELLKDISFQSIFPEKEIIKEKSVILEEMGMYFDNPEESIHDDFEELLFEGHPLAHNILGYPETIRNFRQKDLVSFIGKNLNTHKTVLSIVSNLPTKKVLRQFEKYFSDIPEKLGKPERSGFNSGIVKSKEVFRNTNQTYCVIGQEALPFSSDERLPLFLLTNILGGPALNSRLNLALREKYGMVYNIDAQLNTYTDTGHLTISFSTEKRQLEKSKNLIFKELKRLREEKLGVKQLHMAKEQLMGQIAISEENNVNFMLMMGRSLIDSEKIEGLNEVFEKIRGISADDLRDLANKYLQEDQFSLLTFLPEN